MIASKCFFVINLYLCELCRQHIKGVPLAYNIIMYEVTIGAPNQDKYLLNYVANKMSGIVSDANGICCQNESAERSYYTFATADVYKRLIAADVCGVVSDAIVLGYKNRFVRQLLKSARNDFFSNVLINTICVYDSPADKRYVRSLIEADKPIFLDGYYNFRIGNLKKKWRDVCRLVSDNACILYDDRLILEFLQYLFDTAERNVCAISVSLQNDGFWLFDEHGWVLPKTVSLAKCTSAAEEVMLNLICSKPQNVTIYHNCSLNSDFKRMCDALFAAKYIAVK